MVGRERPCSEEAPFEMSTPQGVAYRPTCTAHGHKYGHSIELDDGTIITWGEAVPDWDDEMTANDLIKILSDFPEDVRQYTVWIEADPSTPLLKTDKPHVNHEERRINL